MGPWSSPVHAEAKLPLAFRSAENDVALTWRRSPVQNDWLRAVDTQSPPSVGHARLTLATIVESLVGPIK